MPLTSSSTMTLDGVTRVDVNRVADRTQARVQPDGSLRFAEYRVDRRPRSVTGVPTYCDATVRDTPTGVEIDVTYRESAYGIGWPYFFLAFAVVFAVLAAAEPGPRIPFAIIAGLALLDVESFVVGRIRRFHAAVALLDSQLRWLFAAEARSDRRSDAE